MMMFQEELVGQVTWAHARKSPIEFWRVYNPMTHPHHRSYFLDFLRDHGCGRRPQHGGRYRSVRRLISSWFLDTLFLYSVVFDTLFRPLVSWTMTRWADRWLLVQYISIIIIVSLTGTTASEVEWGNRTVRFSLTIRHACLVMKFAFLVRFQFPAHFDGVGTC